jgi:spermidine/putrescine transport system substrate-binding protein
MNQEERSDALEASQLNRRRFLQLSAALGVTAASGGILAACGGGSSGGGPAKAGSAINILTWETYHEPDWVKAYTKKAGVEVKVTEAGSVDEMYAKARSGGDWDIIVFDSGSIPRYRKADLIAPLDASKVPNTSNITPSIPSYEEVNTFDGELWGLPYNWGTQPLMYDTKAVSPAPTSWEALWDPKYKGKVVMFDDSYITMPMIALYVGAEDPYNLTDPEWEKVRDALKRLRPQVRTIATGFDDAVTIYAQGDGVIGYCQNVSIVANLNDKGKSFEYTFPREGTPLWIDNSIITKRGDRQEVYDFISNSLSLPWQGDFINFSANNGILTEDDARKAGVKPEVMKNNDIVTQGTPGFTDKMSVISPPESVEKRLEVWNEFKAGV